MPKNDPLQKWLNALRSGHYEQAQGYLRIGDSYCCLGVACDLYDIEHGADVWRPTELRVANDTVYRYECAGEEEIACLPSAVQAWLGLEVGVSSFIAALVILNDDKNASFTEIADYIEEHLPRKESQTICL